MNRTETTSTTLYIPQMDCPQELGMIRAGFRGDEGIHSLQADYLARSLRVQYDPQLWTPDKIRDRVVKTGLHVESVRVPVVDRWHDGWLDAAKDSPEMVVAIGLLAIATMESWANGSANTITALCAMIVCIAGPSIGFRAWQSLRLRHLDMHVLIVLATLGALLIGESLEAATLVVLFRLSLGIEQLSQRRAQWAIESLANLNPQWAHRLQGEENAIEDVSIEQLKMGDRVLVRPGERLPTDGLVVLGGSSVDESHVTGEAMPVEKSMGSCVFGGTLCGEGTLTIEVTRVANDSMVSRIRQMLNEARSSQAPTEQLVERFARYYTPAVIAAAAATAIVPPLWTCLLSPGTASWDVTQFKTWFFRALVMLVVACPCALVIATPITVICGLYRGSRLGALIKGGAFLERLGQIRWIAFDKTGTVTEGKPVVVEVHPTGDITRDELLTLAATLESHSEHPIARAITRAAASSIGRVESFEVLRGFGVRGVVQGRRTTAASLRYVRDQFQDLLSPTLTAQLEEKTLGCSVVLVVREEIQDTFRPAMGDANLRHGCELLGWLILSDSLRHDAVLSMKKLRGLGVERMVLLTGDSSAAAQPIADQLGFDGVLADLLPDDKLRVVRELTFQQPHLVMVGDGVNDAPALTAAPLGIAMGEGASNVSQGSSDIVLMAADLERLVDLVRLGKQVRRVLRQNIVLAIGMKLLALALAFAGFASMWLAVAADMGASLLVIANGMRVLQIHDHRVGR